MRRQRTGRRVIPTTAECGGHGATWRVETALLQSDHSIVGIRPTDHGIGNPGICGIVMVIVLVPIVKLMLGLSPDDVVVVVPDSVLSVGEVDSVVVGADEGVVVAVVVAVREVVGPGGDGLEPEPPNSTKTISTRRSRARAANKTHAHGLRYHGRGGSCGGPGGGPPGGCCPYGCCPYGCSPYGCCPYGCCPYPRCSVGCCG